MSMIGSICYNLSDKCRAVIYIVGTYSHINWDKPNTSELGEQFITYDFKDVEQQSYIWVAHGMTDEYILRLVETKRYILKMECDKDSSFELPHFQNEGNKFLKCDRDKDSVSFQFINYLGRSKMSFNCDNYTQRLHFEVVPDKMNYEDDYVCLTEALAEVCSGLLLEYSGTTSNVYSHSEDTQKTLLEQFIFLRQFCYGQNLQGIFESVKRNPDRILAQEEEFKPTGTGIPSKKFYTNPFSYSREWINLTTTGRGFIPRKVAVTRKYDSLDTPANRFIKYAFHKIDEVCVALISVLDKEGQAKQAECYKEAKTIHKILEGIFIDSFFDEVGQFHIMPQNNQVLQKREGYTQILSAYTMLDLALQLDWKGQNDVYEGESKNVALLYEYWLFFELYKIIRSIEGCETVKTEENPFLINEKGITVSLESGKKSCQSFVIERYGVKINLYYNRTFSRTEFRTTKYEGSYSRPFRPDYTLAIFPISYTKDGYYGEGEAIKRGAVSYVHFDAKYRITDLTTLIGKYSEVAEDEEELIINDKTDSVINTYKRGDLLKMHTYNDAIRRTIGSYVLYPGSYNTAQQGNETYRLYDEILPGVGAFSMKPSIGILGENELKKFIESLIAEREANNSRLNRLNYYTDMVLREPSVIKRQKTVSSEIITRTESMCVIGYIRGDSENDYYHFLKENGLLKSGAEFLFYFYAIKGQDVYTHHKDIFSATDFRFYINQISETNLYILEPVLCKIISNELVSKSELVEKLCDRAYATEEVNHHADFYYVLNVRVDNDAYSCDKYNLSDINSQNGNDTFSPHSPKVICY